MFECLIVIRRCARHAWESKEGDGKLAVESVMCWAAFSDGHGHSSGAVRCNERLHTAVSLDVQLGRLVLYRD
jgi:hypothetical protein